METEMLVSFIIFVIWRYNSEKLEEFSAGLN